MKEPKREIRVWLEDLSVLGRTAGNKPDEKNINLRVRGKNKKKVRDCRVYIGETSKRPRKLALPSRERHWQEIRFNLSRGTTADLQQTRGDAGV